MLRLLVIFLVSLGLPVAGQDQKQQDAEKATADWLALVDAHDYAGSWDKSAQFFKSALTKEQWEAKVKPVRDQIGELKSRKLKSAQYTETLPGAPPGKYFVMQYDSSYAVGPCIETAVPMQEKDGSWKVSGYFVKPAQ